MVIPYATEEKLVQFAANPDVRILSNTAALQAIAYDKTHTRMYIFYEAGECDDVRVSAPCMVSVEEKDGGCVLTVCEPTQKLLEVVIHMAGRYEQIGIVPEAEVHTAEETEIRIRTENAVGYNFRIHLLA